MGLLRTSFVLQAIVVGALAKAQLTVVDVKGKMYGANLAIQAGATAFASSDAFSPGHQAAYLNDGLYGDTHSWIGQSIPDSSIAPGGFAGIALAKPIYIDHIAWGRANVQYDWSDRWAGVYTVQYTQAKSPNASTPATAWKTIGTVNYLNTGQYANDNTPSFRHCYYFAPVQATGVRIVVPVVADQDAGAATCIDEIEVYGNADPLKLDRYGKTGSTFSVTDFEPLQISADGKVVLGLNLVSGYFQTVLSVNGVETKYQPYPESLSADGTTFGMGDERRGWRSMVAFRGIVNGPLQTILPPKGWFYLTLSGLSGDGKQMAGYALNPANLEVVGCYYPQQGLPILFPSTASQVECLGFSADGTSILGYESGSPNQAAYPDGPFVWRPSSGLAVLDTIPGFTPAQTTPAAISSDGTIVVGKAAGIGHQAWRWTQGTGSATMDYSHVSAVDTMADNMNLDGTVVVGEADNYTTKAQSGLIWTRERGKQLVTSFLAGHGIALPATLTIRTAYVASTSGPFLVLGGLGALNSGKPNASNVGWIAKVPRNW